MSEGDEDARDRALQRAIADACLGGGADDALVADLGAFLASHGVHPDDVDAIVASPPRLAVYRSLIRNGMGAVVLRMLPRTVGALDGASPGRFSRDMAAFVDEVGPRTHYLRDVPAELVAWAAPRWAADADVAPYVVDLARFELAAFEIGAAESVAESGAATPSELALNRAVMLHPSVRVLRLGWAVHEESEGEPAPRPVALLGYRDASHEVLWLELEPVAADVIARLLEGRTLGAAVNEACAAAATTAAAEIGAIAALLADLGGRGAVLGARG